MDTVTISLWLPVGRANFFDRSGDTALLDGPSPTEKNRRHCQAGQRRGVPQLQVSVLRRMLEVMPPAFGYSPVGTCVISEDIDEVARPVQVEMTLHPATAKTPASVARGKPGTEHGARAANDQLVAAGVRTVTARADENGAYVFTAAFSSTSTDAAQTASVALLAHVCTLFGGPFLVERLEQHADRDHAEGTAAVRRYNGLDEVTQSRLTAPRGILNFFQLNLVVEAICNESLLPAVFFEHNDFVTGWNARPLGSSPVLRTVGELIERLAVPVDADTLHGQVIVLRRFLSVTTRESLQRLKWAVESVRRSLLDQMMGVLHRRTRFIQLNLGATAILRTPELAEEGTETQLRGYVMLVGAKLPLVANIGDLAELAVAQLQDRVEYADDDEKLRPLLHDLIQQQHNWQTLFTSLRQSVEGLNVAITHEWREKLLYEQEQTRSEQEAMAEVERSRRGRLPSKRLGDAAYNALMLVLTVLTVLYAVRSTATPPGVALDWLDLLGDLWPVMLPIIGGLAFFYLVIPASVSLRRRLKERRGDSETYGYELAFRFDEDTSWERMDAWLHPAEPVIRIPDEDFFDLRIVPRGSSRIEGISVGTTHLKIHSVVTFRTTRFRYGRYARFEIVNEVVIRRVANNIQYFLRKCRLFGDSPTPLTHDQLLRLAGLILDGATHPLAVNGVSDVLDLARIRPRPDIPGPVAPVDDDLPDPATEPDPVTDTAAA